MSVPGLAREARPQLSSLYRLQFEAAQDCWVLLYPEGMVKLNSTAAEILRRCDGQASVQRVITTLERDFGQLDLGDDVCRFLSDAFANGWLVSEHQP